MLLHLLAWYSDPDQGRIRKNSVSAMSYTSKTLIIKNTSWPSQENNFIKLEYLSPKILAL